jgi:hypothetical protein
MKVPSLKRMPSHSPSAACLTNGLPRSTRGLNLVSDQVADLHRAGFNLRKPPIFNRVGIPGSGGPDWLRNDYEFIVCTTRTGKLPWADNTACGHPPKWAPATRWWRAYPEALSWVRQFVHVGNAGRHPGSMCR